MEVSRQRGITLIELAVSLSVCVIGLLAVAKMQVQSFGTDRITNLRSLAISHVNNLAEEIISVGHKPVTKEKMSEWEANIARNLPLGLAKVEHNNNDYTIEVSWYSDETSAHSGCHLIQNINRQCVQIHVKD